MAKARAPAPKQRVSRPPAADLTKTFAAALALHEKGRIDEARPLYEEVLAAEPGHFDALNNLGLIRKARRDFAGALELLDRAIAVGPQRPEAHNNRGNVLRELRRIDEALASFDRAVELRRDYAVAHHNRGIALKELKRHEAALASYGRAIELRPDYAEAHCEQGGIHRELGDPQAALASYDRALALRPDYPEAWNNRGLVLKDLGRFDEALEHYARAIALKPDYTDAHWNSGLLSLLRGDFGRGWAEYEWRWRDGGHCRWELPGFAAPRWSGAEPLAGRTILLRSEQGLGDTLQFCRYAGRLAAGGARVLLEVQPPLVGLLRALDGVAGVFGRGEPLPAFDFWCPLLSLPLACGGTAEATPSRYLVADPAQVAAWQQRLGPRTRPRVGLVWSGSTTHANDRNRSIALADFLALLGDQFDFVSLQKDVRDGDRELLAATPAIRDVAAGLADFTDTAALCELLDLVISVDTSVVHLAAGLGRPTWVLLPANPDWRWQLERDDSPWYPTLRLWRRGRTESWRELLPRVRAALAAEFDVAAAAAAAPEVAPAVLPPPAPVPTPVGAVAAAHYRCPICDGVAPLFDVVDFNKCCEEQRGKRLPLSGRPVYYARCGNCGHCFAPEFAGWPDERFLGEIYNEQYVEVDPDYVQVRPRTNAALLARMFDAQKEHLRHLDYGGGNGLLRDRMLGRGWNSTSFDPFQKSKLRLESLGRFNLITAFEVFEHVPDPQELMRRLRALMDEQCLVFFSTLVSDGRIAPDGRLGWWYASPRNGHISLFTTRSLELLAAQHDLRFASLKPGLHFFGSRRVPEWARGWLP